jgi:hypothetical protein
LSVPVPVLMPASGLVLVLELELRTVDAAVLVLLTKVQKSPDADEPSPP